MCKLLNLRSVYMGGTVKAPEAECRLSTIKELSATCLRNPGRRAQIYFFN